MAGGNSLFHLGEHPNELHNRTETDGDVARTLHGLCDTTQARLSLDVSRLRAFLFQARPLQRTHHFDQSRGVKNFPGHPEDVDKGEQVI
jgi:hypothetical protein